MRFPQARPTDPYLLIVDDEPVVLDVTRVMAGMLGYQPLLANTADHALELFREHARDIHHVLVDLHLPVRDGVTLAAELREIADDVRVELMTGDAAWADTLDALPEGIHGILVKPFSVPDLEHILGLQARAA